MPKIMIKDLKIGDKFESFFVIKQKQVKKTQKGDDYLNLKLSDRSGDIDAKMWDSFADIQNLSENSFIKVSAEASEYNSKLQLTLRKARPVQNQEIEIADFVKHTSKNIEEMFKNVCGAVESMTNPEIKKLLQAFLNDTSFTTEFKKAPAAVSMHSACIGGLLEHVDGMINLALYVTSEYPKINRDLLLAGVILHDMGKIKELNYSQTFSYNDCGKLVGHLALGLEMLHDKIREIGGISEQTKTLLEHLIVSHHGVPEFGAIKHPATLEAIILYHLDNLDAKIVGFNEFVENNQQTDSNWTPKSYMFENRELFLGAYPRAEQ